MIYSATTNPNFVLRFSSVLSVVKIDNLAFSYIYSSQSYEASNTKSVRPWKMGANLLRCWKQFRRELLIISIAFKAIYLWSPQNFHNWLTLDWNFSECSLSKTGLKMTTINKKIWNQLKTNFARSNPAIENQTPQTYIWSVVFDE